MSNWALKTPDHSTEENNILNHYSKLNKDLRFTELSITDTASFP